MRQRKRAESLLSMDQLKRMEMEKMFNLYDDDGSGEIDTAELGQLMNSLGRVMTEPELCAMFAELDDD
jgi:Ca2+-binding EF-hand superfamily protein